MKYILDRHTNLRIMTVNRDKNKAREVLPLPACEHVEISDENDIVDFRPEVVLHLATYSTSSCQSEVITPMIDANITFGVKLLDVLSRIDSVAYFINVGTFAEYRLGHEAQKPAYLYSASKSAFRNFLSFYSDMCGFRFTHVVPYTIYGGQDRSKKLIDYLIESTCSDTPIDMTYGEQMLDFIHIDDVLSCFEYMIFNYSEYDAQEVHLGTGVGTRIRDLATMIEEIRGVKCNINWGARSYRPLDVMKAVAPVGNINWKASIAIQEGVKMLNINNN